MLKTIKAANVGVKTRIRGAIGPDSVQFSNGDIEFKVACDGASQLVEFHHIAELELLLGGTIGQKRELKQELEYSCFNAKELSKKLSYCLSAADVDSTRYALGGVCWDVDTLVGTDGRRLHRQDIGKCLGGGGIIPPNGINAITAAISEFKDSAVFIRFNKENVFVHGDCWLLTIRLVEGRFPNWQQVIPSHDEIETTEKPYNTKQLREHLKETIKRVKLEEKVYVNTLTKQEKKLYIGEKGLPLFSVAGMDFDARYILDGISNIGETTFYPKIPKSRFGASVFGDCVVMPLSK